MDGERDQLDLQFSRLWTKALPVVSGFVAGMVPDGDAADDILQETAMAVFKEMGRYDPDRSFAAWAVGIAKNKVGEHWRRHGRKRELVRDPRVMAIMAETTVEMAAEIDSRRRALWECLDTVKYRSWNLLTMHYVNGDKPRAIAEQLGISATNVRVLLSRIRQVLRKCIQRRLQLGNG